MWRADSFEKTLMLGKVEGRRRMGQRMRWLDGITDSTGRPGMLWFMGSWRVGHDWATELNCWAFCRESPMFGKFICFLVVVGLVIFFREESSDFCLGVGRLVVALQHWDEVHVWQVLYSAFSMHAFLSPPFFPRLISVRGWQENNSGRVSMLKSRRCLRKSQFVLRAFNWLDEVHAYEQQYVYSKSTDLNIDHI